MTARKATLIRIPYALLGDRLVHISEVSSGLSHQCVCPECKAALIARKGQKVRHHFAHYQSTNCQPETVIHRIAKRLLAERIAASLAARQELQIRWTCACCDDVHCGNLLKHVRSIHVERQFVSCRPDITLCKANNKPIALIEIVVTHPPDDNVRHFCRDSHVELLECHLRSEDDLEQLAKSIPLPITRGSYCPRTRCSRCQARLTSNRLHVVVGKCNRCKHDMNIAFASRDRLVRSPDEFSPEEITAAQNHGVVLQLVTSKTLDAQYVANVCPRCKAFVGKHFMLEHMNWKADAVCWSICSDRNVSLAAESSHDKLQLRMFDES